jgi:hypothetical protein
MIATPLQQWTNNTGVPHCLRPACDLSPPERRLLNVLRQQAGISARLLDAGFYAPAISQALPHMMRMMLRILLPHVADEEIAAFDSTEGNDLLVDWWAVTDAPGGDCPDHGPYADDDCPKC